MTHIDRVPEAAVLAVHDQLCKIPWRHMADTHKIRCEEIAAAVIDALGLTESHERHPNCICRHPRGDHSPGRCHASMRFRDNPCTCTEFRPRHRSRLVGRWEPTQGGENA